MMNASFHWKMLNVAMRGLTLVTKLIFVISIAKILSPSQVGFWGLFVAGIGYGVLLLGMEFHGYATRELISSEVNRKIDVVNSQILLYLTSYSLAIPIVVLTLIGSWSAPWFIFMFCVLLILEHISQEFNRILNALSLQLAGSLVNFIRSAAWCMVSLPILIYFPSSWELEIIFGAWALGALMSSLISFKIIVMKIGFPSLKGGDYKWVIGGLKLALPMLLVATTFQGFFLLDKIVFESHFDKNVFGAYIFFSSLAAAVVSFIDAGIIVFYSPLLVKSAQKGDKRQFKKYMSTFGRNVVISSGVLCIAVYYFGVNLTAWVDNKAYSENFYLFKWIILSIWIFNISNIPHVGLYALKQDHVLSYIQVLTFIFFVVILYILLEYFGPIALPLSMMLSFLLLFVAKYFAYAQAVLM